jgi:hypothetical protein
MRKNNFLKPQIKGPSDLGLESQPLKYPFIRVVVVELMIAFSLFFFFSTKRSSFEAGQV